MSGQDAVRDAVEGAMPFDGNAETAGDAVARLAALTPLEYDQVRNSEAKNFGVRLGTLDEAVTKARKGHASKTDQHPGDNAFLAEPEPWPEPVAGDHLLDRLTEAARTHLVLPKGAAETIALWVLHAHAHDCFGISPVLAVTSPTPECGKTTCLTLLGALVPRACPAANITAPALFRAVEKWRPTLLIDEADTFLRNSDDLRGVLNSGHQRANAFVIRTIGDNHEPKRFRTWSPKAVALIGKLPATLASRAIHIELRRKTAAEIIEPLRADRLDHLEPLRRQAARWVADNILGLHAANPEIPASLSGRTIDNWRPLLAIADLAGEQWPALARSIAELLGGTRSDQSSAVILLEDIRRLFADRGADRLPSAELAEALASMEDRPWPEWSNGKPITPRQIAKLLEPFRVTPGTIRMAIGTAKGYKRDAFDDAFARYLPEEHVTSSHRAEPGHFVGSRAGTTGRHVTEQISTKPLETRVCDGATATSANRHESAGNFPEMPAFLRRNGNAVM